MFFVPTAVHSIAIVRKPGYSLPTIDESQDGMR